MEADEAGTLAALKARRREILKPLVAMLRGHIDIDADGDLDLLNANHGACGAANPIELWRNVSGDSW